ncbi:hypothetical protein LINGRAHAP2_LOCUS11269 [Linum grandiflorum]
MGTHFGRILSFMILLLLSRVKILIQLKLLTMNRMAMAPPSVVAASMPAVVPPISIPLEEEMLESVPVAIDVDAIVTSPIIEDNVLELMPSRPEVPTDTIVGVLLGMNAKSANRFEALAGEDLDGILVDSTSPLLKADQVRRGGRIRKKKHKVG